MRKALLLGVLLSMACGAADGTTYTWNGASASWQTSANWNPNGVPSSLTGDNALLNGGTVTTTGSVSVGAIKVNGATLNFGANPITTSTDNGGSGLFYYNTSSVAITCGGINAYGNVWMSPGSSLNSNSGWTLRLMGTNQGVRNRLYRYGIDRIEVYGTGAWDNGMDGFPGVGNTGGTRTLVDVKSGARLGDTAAVSGYGWQMYQLILRDGQSNLPTWKAAVPFTYDGNGADNGIVREAIAGGVNYPSSVTIVQNAGANQKNDLVWRVQQTPGSTYADKLDFKIAGSFRIQNNAVSNTQNVVFSSVENTTAANPRSVNFEVCGDLNVGTVAGSTTQGLSILKLNNSTAYIGGQLNVGTRSDGGNYSPTGSVQFDNATIWLGQHLRFQKPHTTITGPNYNKTIDAWRGGTSTIICWGNGTSATYGKKDQTLYTYGGVKGTFDNSYVSLGNLIIRNDCGTVSLATAEPYYGAVDPTAGILRLNGDLRLERGKFNDNNKPIMFNGPDFKGAFDGVHTLYWDNGNCKSTNATKSLDNIILLANSVVTLDGAGLKNNTFKMDNIELDAGSKLYLNGFDLSADGRKWICAQTSSLGAPYDQGLIFGTLVVPEPTTMLLVGSGAIGVLGWMRRRRIT